MVKLFEYIAAGALFGALAVLSLGWGIWALVWLDPQNTVVPFWRLTIVLSITGGGFGVVSSLITYFLEDV